MSRSAAIGYGKELIWALDVIAGILLKHLVDVASARDLSNDQWLARAIERWRVQITLAGDLGVTLDKAWSGDQVRIVVSLLEEACKLLEKRSEIPAAEAEKWEGAPGERFFARRMPVIRTRPVINLGNAIVAMLERRLPAPPAGTLWWFGVEDEPETMRRKDGS